MTTNEQATVTIPLYLPNGLRVTINMPISDHLNAFAIVGGIVGKWQLDGGLINPPNAVEGEESETIVTVMRREKDDGTPIIDFYPEWGAGNDKPYGTYKFLHMYMDDDKVADFLAVSGFKSVNDIPLYAGQAALTRTAGKVKEGETRVPKPFKLVKQQGKEKLGTDGKAFRPWEFVRYEPLAGAGEPFPNIDVRTGEILDNKPATETAWNKAEVGKVLAWAKKEYGYEQSSVKLALGLDQDALFSAWTKSARTAEKTIRDYEAALNRDASMQF